MNRFIIKQLLARVFNRSGLTDLWFYLLCKLKMPYILAINYHGVPEKFLKNFELHLQYYSDHFENIDFKQLNSFFSNNLKVERPRIIVSFDDGFKDNCGAVASLLEKYGLTGWFFIIAGKVGSTEEFAGGKKYFMSWSDIQELSNRGHVIGCHTFTHKNVGKLTGQDLVREVVEAKHLMEHRIGRSISVFCFPFGDYTAYSAESLKLVKAHYEYIFHSCPMIITKGHSKFSIGRNNIESYYDLDTVKFLVSGLYNIKYARRSHHFEKLLGEG